MKVALVTFGTRGDVQPFVALAQGLRRAGHDAYLAAPSNFARLAATHGVPFRAFRIDTEEFADRPEVKRIVASGKLLNFVRARVLRRRHPVLDSVNEDTWELTQDADAMLFRSGAPPAAYSIACKRAIPSVELMYLPLEPSAQLPAVAAGMRSAGSPGFNRLMGHLTYQMFWRMFCPSANRFRRQVLHMPPLPFFGLLGEYARRGQPTFYAYSEAVLPRPADWRPDAHVVGYLFVEDPSGWQPPASLSRFLAEGPKPIYIGFGSMIGLDPASMVDTLLDGIARTGQRAILQAGWGGLGKDRTLPAGVLAVEETPFGWLFPRMAAVISHGGAGTASYALRAGVPSIVFPYNFDQPYWAQRLHELGVSPRPVPIRQLTPERVAAAVDSAVSDPAIARRAAEVGHRIRSEDGVTRAVELFNTYVERFRASR